MTKPKNNALIYTNEYLKDPELRKLLTVNSVNDYNRMEGILVSYEQTMQHYELI